MSALSRLSRKGTLTDDDVARVAAAVAEALAGHPKQAMPTAAPQSPKVQALLRSMHPPMPAPERPAPAPVPAATAHNELAAVAPRPAISPSPIDSIPVVISRGLNGHIDSFQMGDATVAITGRDYSGHIRELTVLSGPATGVKTTVTRRDADNHIAELSVAPPSGKKLYRRGE